jgi:HD superfamily phosphohydrolase YqeK
MKGKISLGHDVRQIRELTRLIYSDHEPYRIQHLDLTARYANRLISHFRSEISHLDQTKLRYAAYAHDILKGKYFEPSRGEIEIGGYWIPQDLNRYVRTNLEVLQPYKLDDYFNTDIQLHSLAAGIFLISNFEVTDPKILYPIFFHSCPILSVYQDLDQATRLMVDIIILADKLSSNYLKLQQGKKVHLDLTESVFGETGKEFNFTQGLLLARLIGQGSSKEEHSRQMTEHYYQRLVKQNPLLAKLKKCPSLDDVSR